MTTVLDQPTNGQAPPAPARPVSIFAEAEKRIYKHRYQVTIHVGALIGGIPRDPNKIEGWIRSKVADKEDLIREAVQAAHIELAAQAAAKDPDARVTAEEAIAAAAALKHLNGFKRDEHGLYLEGRCVKAMLKEAASIRWAGLKWGATRKGTKNYMAEHLFVVEERIYLGRQQADDIVQRFVHSTGPAGPRTSISTEEVAYDVDLTFTVVTDHDFERTQWEDLFVTGQSQGIGATRAQGYGTFVVTGFARAK